MDKSNSESEKSFNLADNVLVTVYPRSQNVPNTATLPDQCHGDRIVEVTTGTENLNSCDALITKAENVPLGIKTADCAPICFTDGKRIGIAHIGWRGLCLSLTEKMLSEFNVENLHIFIGPFMHSFEIKKDSCFDQIKVKFGEKFFYEKNGKINFLFKDAMMSLLPKDVKIDQRSTFEDPSLPSFRRDKTSERLVTVIKFK